MAGEVSEFTGIVDCRVFLRLGLMGWRYFIFFPSSFCLVDGYGIGALSKL